MLFVIVSKCVLSSSKTVPLPLCARCSGMYLGVVAGILFQFIRYPRKGGMPGWKTGIPFMIFVLAFGIDGLNSYLHLFPGLPGAYEPNNCPSPDHWYWNGHFDSGNTCPGIQSIGLEAMGSRFDIYQLAWICRINRHSIRFFKSDPI